MFAARKFLLTISAIVCLIGLLFCADTAWGQQAQGPQKPFRRLLVSYRGHLQVTDSKTGLKDVAVKLYVHADNFPTTEQGEKIVRRGDEFNGLKVGEFVDREPVGSDRDGGYLPGTLPTLELILVKSGKVIILECNPRGGDRFLSLSTDE